jgi:predicted ferric reductase
VERARAVARLSPAAGPRLMLGAIGAGAAAVAVMWFAHTPRPLSGANDSVLAIGRLSGLMAGYAVIVLVALMARIPPLERLVGADRLNGWHVRAGRYTLFLVVLHIVTVAWGYARTAQVSLPHQVSILLREYPDVLLAAVGAALLILVGIASVRVARQRLGYELWYYLHLLTYVAVALAFSHQFANGTDFVRDTAARVAWSTLYLAVGVAVCYYRFVRPAVQGMRQRLTVGRVVNESGDVISIAVHGADLTRLSAKAGQFFRLRFLTPGMWYQSHPFSLSAPPHPDGLRFTVKPLGDHTRALRDLSPGTRVVAEGPFGTLTAERRRRRKVLLIAGGIGIAPLRALFESIPAGPGELTLIYRCRTQGELIFRAELDALALERGASIIYLVGRSADLGDPLGAAPLLALLPDLAAHDVFLCAPPDMAATVTSTLRSVGVPARNIHWESFDLAGRSAGVGRQVVVVSMIALGVGTALGLRTDFMEPAGRSPAAASGVPAGRPATVEAGAAAGGSRTPNIVTVVGSVQRTLYTNVQVEAVLRDGRLVDVRPLLLPNVDARSRQLSAMAAPILRREAIAAGTADIDTVSGATYTSGAYALSLQAALDSRR